VELQIISTFALVAISWWADVLTFFAVAVILVAIFLIIGIFLPAKVKTRENAIVDAFDYKIPVTQQSVCFPVYYLYFIFLYVFNELSELNNFWNEDGH